MMAKGRPPSPETQAKAKRALLEAANDCLKEKSFKEISLREIATRSGQNSAMVAYYFGNKEALFIELLHETIGDESRKLLREFAELPPLNAELALRSLVTQYVSLHRKSPWLSRFIVDNIILKPGKLRKMFVNRVLATTGEKILGLFMALQENGAIAGHYNPQFCRISLISLLAFPFAASPVLKDSFDFDIHKVNLEEWINHTVSILLFGLNVDVNSGQ